MFDQIVSLYRLLDKPQFDEGYCFVAEVDKSPELIDLLDAVGQLDPSFGIFTYRDKGAKIRVEGELPQNSDGHFFSSIEDFIDRTLSLRRGIFRENFYIVDLDYLSNDEDVPDKIIRIKKITEFIWCLREFVAISIDREQSMNGDRIFFLKPSDGKSPQKAAALKINLTPGVIAHNLGSFKILATLKDALRREKTQIEERILLMNTAIAQIIDECEDDDADFEYLVENWGKVNKKYLHDLHAYVSAFSFDTVKKKISDGLIESTTKINNAIGEVATKLLAIPASLGALIIVSNSSSVAGFVVGILGVIVASLIILRTIWHYKNQVQNLADSFSFNMKEATKAKKTFSRSIQEEINRIDGFEKKQKETIEFTFLFYYMVAMLPIIGSLYYIVDAMWPAMVLEYSLYKYCLNFYIG